MLLIKEKQLLSKINTFIKKSILDKMLFFVFGLLIILFVVCAFLKFAFVTDGVILFTNIFYKLVWHDFVRITAVSVYSFPIFFLTNFTNCSFNLIVFIQGLWINLVLLFIVYLNYLIIPEDKKNYFQYSLLLYLITMNLNASFIMTEIFIVTYTFFLVMTIFVFYKINTASYSLLLLLFFCSIILLKPHEFTAFLIPLILFFEFYAFCDLKEVKHLKISKKFFLLIITLMFVLSVPINLHLEQFFINFDIQDVFSCFELHMDGQSVFLFLNDNFNNIIIILLLISSLLFLSYFNKKNLYSIFVFLNLLLSFFLIKNNILYTVGKYRLVNLFMALSIFLLMFYTLKKTLKVNFNKLKILNIFLCITLFINLIDFSLYHNMECNYIYDYTNKTKNIRIEHFSKICRILIKGKGDDHYLHLIPWKCCFFQMLNNENKEIAKVFVLDKIDKSLFNVFNDIETLPNLERFGVTYSKELLEELDKIKN